MIVPRSLHYVEEKKRAGLYPVATRGGYSTLLLLLVYYEINIMGIFNYLFFFPGGIAC